jgi:hypothetical protein
MVCPVVAAATASSRLEYGVAEGNVVARLVGQPVAVRAPVVDTTASTAEGNVPKAPALTVIAVKLRASNERTLSPTVNSRRE